MNRAKFDAASLILGGEIRNRTNTKLSHTKKNKSSSTYSQVSGFLEMQL